MILEKLAIPGVLLVRPEVFEDRRGFFLETYRREVFAAAGVAADFVQDNHSASSRTVLRGLHYQLHRAQAKLVRVVRGEVYDVAVDIRSGSPWFGRHCAVRLSEADKQGVYVPEGFAHGFLVVSERAEIVYKCSDYYCPAHERGIRWDDPALAIDWPLPPGEAPVLSEKDARYARLSETDPADLPVYAPPPVRADDGRTPSKA